ncbi:MAG: hypothetical protein ABIA21_00440 [Candidatus Aenigmatarchaeota archaeon]
MKTRELFPYQEELRFSSYELSLLGGRGIGKRRTQARQDIGYNQFSLPLIHSVPRGGYAPVDKRGPVPVGNIMRSLRLLHDKLSSEHPYHGNLSLTSSAKSFDMSAAQLRYWVLRILDADYDGIFNIYQILNVAGGRSAVASGIGDFLCLANIYRDTRTKNQEEPYELSTSDMGRIVEAYRNVIHSRPKPSIAIEVDTEKKADDLELRRAKLLRQAREYDIGHTSEQQD